MTTTARKRTRAPATPSPAAPPPEAPPSCADCGRTDMVVSIVTADGQRFCSPCWRDGTWRQGR